MESSYGAQHLKNGHLVTSNDETYLLVLFYISKFFLFERKGVFQIVVTLC